MRLIFSLVIAMSLVGCAQLNLKTSVSEPVSIAKSIDVADNDIIRIVTPFADPRVVTTSDAEIQRSQHVLYVLPNGQERIAMFVTDAENEANSISLTLHPKANGVREIDVLGTGIEAPKATRIAATEPVNPASQNKTEVKKTSGRIVEPWDPRPCKLCRNPDDNGSSDYSNESW